MHSTSVGYKAITWAHVLPSTAGSKQKKRRAKREKYKGGAGMGGRGEENCDRRQSKKSFAWYNSHRRMEMRFVMQTCWRTLQKRNFRMSRFNLWWLEKKSFLVIDLAGNINSSAQIGDKTHLKNGPNCTLTHLSEMNRRCIWWHGGIIIFPLNFLSMCHLFPRPI